MKIAFCVAGQPRFFEKGFNTFQKYIFDNHPNDEIHTFLHCWFSDEDVGREYDCAKWVKGKSGVASADTKSNLLDTYKPKKHLIEKQKTFTPPRVYEYAGEQPQHVPFSMFYSVQESIRLKQEYEKENNIKYDWVFRARYDFCLESNIDLTKYDNNIMYVPNNIQVNNGTFNEFNDMFAFSSSTNMDKYATMYDNLDDYYTRDGIKYVQEALLGQHFKCQRILVSPLPLRAGMYRQNDIHWIIDCDKHGHLK